MGASGWARAGIVLLVAFVAWSAFTEVRVRLAGKPVVYAFRAFGTWPEEYGRVVGSLTWNWSMYLEVEASAEPGAQPDRLGNPTAGEVLDHSNSNGLGANRIRTSSLGGRAVRAWIYTPGPIDEPPNDRFEMGLYADAGGAPGRLVALTPTGSLTSGWNSLPIEAELAANSTYWLVYNTNATSIHRNNPTYTPLPDAIDTQVRNLKSPLMDRLTERANYLGGAHPSVAITLALLLVTLVRHRSLALTMLGGIAMGLLVVLAIKGTLSLPYGSYPSGHVFRAAFVAIWLVVLVRSWWAGVAGLVAVGTIGFSVIYAGGHDMPEVIGGALLGTAMGCLAAALAPQVVVLARGARVISVWRQPSAASVSLGEYANDRRRQTERPPAPHP